MNRTATAWILSSVFLVSGCAEINESLPSDLTDKLKPYIPGGTAVVGGVIGYKACDGKTKKVLCTAGGAALGAWLGSQLVKHLDEQDMKQRNQAVDTALSRGGSEQWSNPQSGNSGTIKVTRQSPTQATKPVAVLKDRVQTVPPLEAVGEQYRFKSATNVRGGPGTDYRVVDRKGAGDIVDVIGQVKGKPWYFVGEHNVGTGYAYKNLLEPVPLKDQVAAAEPANPFEPGKVETSNVAMTAECVAVTEEITIKSGESETQTTTLCRGPNGWEKV